jgi:hypothetical protein
LSFHLLWLCTVHKGIKYIQIPWLIYDIVLTPKFHIIAKFIDIWLSLIFFWSVRGNQIFQYSIMNSFISQLRFPKFHRKLYLLLAPVSLIFFAIFVF